MDDLVRSRTGALAAPAAEGDGIETMWRRKRGEAEEKLDKLSRDVRELDQMVKGCARSVIWLNKDAKSGLRTPIKCSEIATRSKQTHRQQDELEEYLARGLAEECRRAGCLPGWIR